jgi:hypothetical protein
MDVLTRNPPLKCAGSGRRRELVVFKEKEER